MTLRGRLDEALLIAGAFVAALLTGLLISRDQAALPFGLIAVALILLIGARGGLGAFLLLTGAVLFQVPLGTLGPIAQLQPLEVVVPLLAVALAIGPGYRYKVAQAGAKARASLWVQPRAMNIAVGVYAAVVVGNYIRTQYVIHTAAAVQRPMYAFAVALGAYGLAFIALASGRVSFDKVFRLLYPLCLVMSVIGLIAVVFKLPLNLGGLGYSVASYSNSSAVRVGFLEIYGTIGLALVAVGYGRYRAVTGVIFAMAMVASGGRSATIGLAAGLLLFLLLGRRWTALALTAATALAVVAFAAPALQRQGQVQRLTDVNSSAFTNDARSFFYSQSLKDFRQHPVFGTGIGSGEVAYDSNADLAAFHQDQLDYGGHATYHSLLKNFGLVGFIPYVAALLIALWQLGRLAWRDRLSGFFLIILVSQGFVLYAAGNGSDFVYFFFLGGAAAALATVKKRLRRAPAYPQGPRRR
jgi:O-antigen ligase